MPDPLVVQQANAFRAALLRREAAQMQTMTARWLGVERNLETSITDVLAEITRRQEAGEQFGRHSGPYVRLERYRELLRQVRSELVKFGNYMEAQVNAGIADHVSLGVEHSATAIATAAGAPEVASQFNRLSVAATENMAAVLQENAAVGELLRNAWPDAAVRMTDALTNGVALGWNPRKTARAMREGLQSSAFQRALTIARTEQLRAYRTATQENYRASGVVRGYKRLASKSMRTCIACLIADGTFYELEVSFEEHPRGRCTLIPVLIGQPEPTWITGKQWFESQPASAQRQILGPAAFDAWQDKAITLEDLVERHEHPVWGGSLGVKSLKRALGDGEAKRYIDKAMGRATGPVGAQQAGTVTAAEARKRVIETTDARNAEVAVLQKEIAERESAIITRQGEMKAALKADLESGRITQDEYAARRLDLFAQYKEDEGAFTELYQKKKDLQLSVVEAARSHLRVDNPASANVNASGRIDAKVTAMWKRGASGFNDLVDASIMPANGTITVKTTRDKRSYFSPSEDTVFMHKDRQERTVIHELGHWLEHHNADVHRKILDFYDRRTAGENLKWMGKGYARHEKTRKDKFVHPYMGKEYGRSATEILSMGLELFYADPVQLARDDSDYFDFIYDLVRGR